MIFPDNAFDNFKHLDEVVEFISKDYKAFWFNNRYILKIRDNNI